MEFPDEDGERKADGVKAPPGPRASLRRWDDVDGRLETETRAIAAITPNRVADRESQGWIVVARVVGRYLLRGGRGEQGRIGDGGGRWG